MGTLLFLSRRFLWKQQASRSVKVMRGMIVLGIALSVAALVTALSVTAGFERDYKKGLLSFNAHVLILPGEGEKLSAKEVQEAFAQIGLPNLNLVSLTPYLFREALLIHKGVIKGVILKGIPRGKDEMVLGAALAKMLGVGEGEGRSADHGPWTMDQKQEMVKLLIPKGKEISDKNIKRLKVGGVFRSGLYEFDSQFAWVDIEQLKKLFGLPLDYQGYELKISNPDLAPELAEELEKKLGPLVSVQNWVALNQPLFQALELEKWVFRILMGLMVFVSSLNLIGVVLILIFRNQKTIAILRALGWPKRQIQTLFMGQGMALGLLGITIGVIVGVVFVFSLQYFQWIPLDPEIYFLEKLPVDMRPLTVVMIALFGLFLVWQASWLAAKRALTIPIREGLHGPG